MGKVVFSISYDIYPEKRDEYLDVVRELKSIIGSEGLESYSVYEHKSKSNSFTEIYTYISHDAWEDADEASNERVDILMTKLSDLVKEKTTQYSTLFEI